MFNSTPSLADIAAVTGGNRDGFGGDGWWAIIILLALFGGFGNRGFGFGGGGGCGDQAVATAADLQRGFDTQAVTNKLNGLENAFASLGYDQLAQMNGINSTVMQTGFGLQSSLDGGFNALGRQLADCCCENRAAIAQVRYDMATQVCDLGHKIESVGQGIRDQITAIRLEDKNDRIAELTQRLNMADLAASQAQQNAYLIGQLKPCPTPAYVVPNPNCCYTNTGCGGY
ncbi:MAG: hypothetical protein IJW29_02255 [Clostridia bacterium]|nr:hypothetical protein [Clostridia bacterium]